MVLVEQWEHKVFYNAGFGVAKICEDKEKEEDTDKV